MNYRAKQIVRAVKWNELNLHEMKDLLEGVVDSNDWDGVEVYSDFIEPYYSPSWGQQEGYYVLKFYAGDDIEVDPDQWVVVYEDNEIEIMHDHEFNKKFERMN